MIRKLEFNELKEYWYTLSGDINLTFTGFYGEYYEICIKKRSTGLLSFYKNLFNNTIFLNRINVYTFSKHLEMIVAFTKYLDRLNKKPACQIEEPNFIDEAKNSNPEFAEYMMTACDGSQGILLTQWAIDRLNKKKYERPQWVIDKLETMENSWTEGVLEKPETLKLDDQEMRMMANKLQTTARNQLNLNEHSE